MAAKEVVNEKSYEFAVFIEDPSTGKSGVLETKLEDGIYALCYTKDGAEYVAARLKEAKPGVKTKIVPKSEIDLAEFDSDEWREHY